MTPDLTSQQRATLKTFILATPAIEPFYTEGNLTGLADALNAAVAPAFIVWRTQVPQTEIMLNGFNWTRVDNLSVGKSRIWEWMFLTGSFDPSKTNIRAGIDATWVGTQADLDVRAAVYIHCKRPASVVEKLFATGTGSDAVPGTMASEGPINTTELIGL